MKSLSSLDPIFEPLAAELIHKIRVAGIEVAIIDTRRTQEEQDHNRLIGVSEVKHSKHQDGLAIDLCPVVLLTKKNWAPADPLWWKMAEIGLALGLRCGLNWDHPMPPVGKPGPWFNDAGHFEMRDPSPAPRIA